MGKSKHTSFSSIDKPNLQHIKSKFRGGNLKAKIKENEKNGENREAEEKEKKRFWCKWLGFVRKRWSNTESCRNDINADLVIRKNSETNGDVKIASHTSSVDIIEIPIDPGKKISKILIKPTKTGIKAVIAQYERPKYHEGTQEENVLVSGDVFPELRQVEDGKEKADEQLIKADGKRLNWKTDAFNTNSEVPKNTEPLLTSALFIRQDLDKIVESAVFIEPNLPTDYTDLRTSDESSQKSVLSNKKRVSYRIKDERNNSLAQTFKTISEPTCKEKTKIMQHQGLKDNLNNLINQFMFLEAEDLLDFSVSQNVTNAKKRVHRSSRNSKTPLLRQLSREVSPEILVNIKPFKEYVSNDYVNIGSSPTVRMIKNQIYGDEDSNKSKRTITLEKTAITCNNYNPKPSLSLCPVLKSSTTYVEAKNSREHCGVTQSILSFPTTEKEIKSICYDYFNESQSDWESLTINDETESDIPSCTIWGVYKTYSASRNSAVVEEKIEEKKIVQNAKVKEKEKENKVKEIKIQENKIKDLVAKQEKVQLYKGSLDEVFSTFDDANHDVVFQKNLAHFKKKINVMPRFDLKKPVINTMKHIQDKIDQKKVKKSQHHFQVAKPDVRGVANIAKITIGNLSENKIEKFRFECLELNNTQKAQRILENIYLLLSDAKLFSRTLSNRYEARTVSFMRSFREVYDMMESNSPTLLEMVIPKSFQENLVKITLIKTESKKALTWSGRFSSDAVEHGTMASVVPLYDSNKNGVDSESSSSFLDTDECYFMSQDLVSFTDLEEIDGFSPTITSKELIRTSTETIIKANDKTDELMISPRIENILIFQMIFEATHSVVQILHNHYREHAAVIYDYKLPIRQLSIKNLSDSDLMKRNVNHEKKSYSDSAMASAENLISVEAMVNLNEKTISVMDEKRLSLGLDGFQILYNNSKGNLYDEDEIMKPVFGRRLGGRDPGFIIENAYKEEEEEEEEQEQDELKKKKNVRSFNEDTIESSGGRVRNILKFKSNSSPRENIIHTEFCVHQHRFRRSFILSKDMEKDMKKRRFHFEKGIQIRRTGSATVGNYKLLSRKNPKCSIEDALRNLVISDELKSVIASENKGEGNKKLFVVDKSGANVKKELVVAAFNSIKEFNSCKGEGADGGKRMSLVIMLSKK